MTGGTWLTTFAPFSLMHALSAGVFLSLAIGVACLGRRWRGRDAEKQLRAAFVWITLVAQTAITAWFFLPAHYDPSISWPLQMCDVVGWIAAIALATGHAWSRTILFFWGLALTTQAFISPTLTAGPASPRYWIFWGGHALIVGAALYDLLVLNYRPTWRGYAIASLSVLCYGSITLPVNVLWGFNYGFIGPSRPGNPTVLDLLGPWPVRIIWIVALLQTTMAVVLLAAAPALRALDRRSAALHS